MNTKKHAMMVSISENEYGNDQVQYNNSFFAQSLISPVLYDTILFQLQDKPVGISDDSGTGPEGNCSCIHDDESVDESISVESGSMFNGEPGVSVSAIDDDEFVIGSIEVEGLLVMA